jgi:hypothetical protein
VIGQDILRIKYLVPYIHACLPRAHASEAAARSSIYVGYEVEVSIFELLGTLEADVESPALELQCNIRDVPPPSTVERVPSDGRLASTIAHGLRILMLTRRASGVLQNSSLQNVRPQDASVHVTLSFRTQVTGHIKRVSVTSSSHRKQSSSYYCTSHAIACTSDA